jgi:hypothetical protein
VKPIALLTYAVILFVVLVLLGPLAWNYVAPTFGLPQLTVWQFFVAGVACRCLLGLGESKK